MEHNVRRSVAHAVGKARGVAHDIADHDWPAGLAQDRFAIRARAAHHLDRPKSRQIPRERIVEAELALLPQLHQRDAGHRLGHRKYLHQSIALHGPLGFAVGVTNCAKITLRAALPDQRRDASGAPSGDHLPKRRIDPAAVQGEARRLGQRVRFGQTRHGETQSNSRQCAAAVHSGH